MNIWTKLTWKRDGGGWENTDIAEKMGGGLWKYWHWLTTLWEEGVGKMMTLADKGGGGFGSPFLVDMICEQPLTRVFKIR